jgi:hypothetical protein
VHGRFSFIHHTDNWLPKHKAFVRNLEKYLQSTCSCGIQSITAFINFLDHDPLLERHLCYDTCLTVSPLNIDKLF